MLAVRIEMKIPMEDRTRDTTQDDLVSTELKRGAFKLQNEDYEEAEKIFENVAVTYDDPTAWMCLGGIKFHQLDSGKSKVQGAILCFEKALEFDPDSKKQYQQSLAEMSLQQIEKLRDSYLDTKMQVKKAGRGLFWNALLTGAAIGYGSQRSSKGNNVFRGAAGVAGSAYALNRVGQHSSNKKELKNLLPFYQQTVKELVEGARLYCSDNLPLYRDFLEKLDQLKLPSFFGIREIVAVKSFDMKSEV